ncbi:MAG: adenylate/guanylate cyclase domain-containing protein [Anaerolineae bacterium]
MTENEGLLAHRERALRFLMALDDVRDLLEEDGDPNHMFEALALLLREQLAADACGILLLAETSDDVEYAASTGVSSEKAVEFGRAALKLNVPGVLEGTPWQYTFGGRIMLREGTYPLGSFFVARVTTGFSSEEIELLELAESQLDSAVLQARMIWKIAQRNKELEAIYQIDRLRDSLVGETELINRFTALLLENFKADLCLFFLSHIDQGDLIMRGVVDKEDLSTSVLTAIRDSASQITIPQVIETPAGVDNLHLLAAPFIVSNVRLGAVIIGRKKDFTIADHRLLYAMISQMDSAIVHSRVALQLGQRNKELETIYRLDHIRDQDIDFDNMLQLVLQELQSAISCEAGYIMLYKERGEEQLELKATTSEGILDSPEYLDYVRHISRLALEAGEMVHESNLDAPASSIAAVPLILNERILGVFGLVNSSNPRGFNAEDRRMLTAITSQVDTAIFERLERRRMRKLLTRSVDPKVIDHLLQYADDQLLAGERVTITVLFADIRGSTEWAERIPAEELVSNINVFLSRMTEVIFKYGGTLDKFVGDEVIGLFGTPLPMEDHALIACRAALEMQAEHAKLQAEIQAQGLELPPIGIGVSSGEAIAGEFGPPTRAEFTAMGRIVNLGARLCSAAKAGQVVISHTTFELIQDKSQVIPLEPIALKGISQPTHNYLLQDVAWK